MIIWLDLETRSQCDLKRNGLYRYAQHPTTGLICLSYAIDDQPVKTWFPEDGPPPVELLHALADPLVYVYAHNAAFERLLFDYVVCNDYNLPAIPLNRWRCSAARAMAHGLPAALADLCRALNIPTQKMPEGARLISQYSAPGHQTAWQNDDKAIMQLYCETDVEVMRQACSVLRELEPYEWEQYHTVERFNDRGVPVDIDFAQNALRYADDVREDVCRQIELLTSGKVKKATERKTRDEWLRENLSADLLGLIEVKSDGVTKIKFDEPTRKALSQAEGLPEPVAKFIDLVEQAGGSTIAKYSSMVNTHVDGRVHGALVWSGAGATGRLSSKNLQLQNFRRDSFDDPQPHIDLVNNFLHMDTPADTLGRLIRAAITHCDGVTFSDFAQIEARVLPWLAMDSSAETVLDIFRKGRDLYTENAVKMFRLPSADKVDKNMRQAAKVAVLACGFGGGKNALGSMAKAYGMKLSEEQASDIVGLWRSANPWASGLWYGLKDAAHDAVRYPREMFTHGRISFLYDGADWLWMRLPSGRCLAYFSPRFEEVMMPWGDLGLEVTCLWGSNKPKVGQPWPRRTLNHLILSENATQATAADLMRETMVRADKAGLPVLFSVHDELVVQGDHVARLQDLMTYCPEWAAGLPLAAETKHSLRYGK
jgi:DNA polymerase